MVELVYQKQRVHWTTATFKFSRRFMTFVSLFFVCPSVMSVRVFRETGSVYFRLLSKRIHTSAEVILFH